MKRQKNRKYPFRPVMVATALTTLAAVATIGFCQPPAADIAVSAAAHVEKAIQIQQTSYKDQAAWEREKSDLALEYENLIQQKQDLENRNNALTAQINSLETLNTDLAQQKTESIRLASQLIPFLHTVHERIAALIATDTPFLTSERTQRLSTLSRMMKDPEITISEKYRKIMEGLFIEAEYGNTIEVYQDKVLLPSSLGGQTLGTIFRLGRVSLFFLSLDQTVCGVYNPDKRQWQVLPDTFVPAICSAVKISSRQRSVELLSIPIGRLASQGGDL